MGQCVSGLGISNKCEKFKKAFNKLLEEENPDGIFIAKVMFILKGIYEHDFNMVSSEELQCITAELNCMISFLSPKVYNAVKEKDEKLSNMILSLSLLTHFLVKVTKNANNKEFKLLDLLYESKAETDSELDSELDITSNITTEEDEKELNQILLDVGVEIAEELKNQMPPIPDQKGGNTNQHKEDIKHLRKLLKNKKLTDNQKEQYLKKIDSIKSKIQKQNKTDKINKCKEHIKNLQKTLKNKNITESQKQQCHHKISNYKLKMEELK
tara:strand:- start:3165 stop:3971 length:807 start_codon:yes stop_codon:yes gene_type:complete